MKYKNLKLENQICHRLYTASNGLTRVYRELLTDLDVTYPQYVVLMALWEKDEITINDLIAKTMLDGGSLSLILKKMEDKKILTAQKAKDDKRVRIITLTARGKKLIEKAAGIPKCVLGALPSITPDDMANLISLIDKLNGDLGEYFKES